MKNFIKFFNYLSYLQYPFLILGLFYAYKPILMGMDNMFEDYNLSLFFFGISMSFSSLVNMKRRTKMGDMVYAHPKRVKWWLIAYKPILMGMDNMFEDYNLSLFFFGISMSFSSLVNMKRRTKMGDMVYAHPKRVKWWLIYMITLIVTTFTLAIITMFITKDERFQEFGIGLFVLGIGVIGLLRMSLEAIEFYQNEVDDVLSDS